MASRYPQEIPAVAADRELGAHHHQLPIARAFGVLGCEGRRQLGLQRGGWQRERYQNGCANKLPLRVNRGHYSHSVCSSSARYLETYQAGTLVIGLGRW